MRFDSLPKKCHVLRPDNLLRLACIFIVVLAFAPGRAMAQGIMVIDDTSAFEGSSGTTILKLPVHFSGAQTNTVTGSVSAVPLSIASNPAVAGSSCGPGIDFVSFNNSQFTIPPNTPNGTLTVNVTICGDTIVEPDEAFLVVLSNVIGATCTGETCSAVAVITNDDGPPGIAIADSAVNTIKGLQRPCVFTVNLHHPASSEVSVHYATRDGSAKALALNGLGAYFATSGTLRIPAGSLSGTISVDVRGLGTGTFFVDLSDPVNGTISDGTGQCTISVTTLTIGTFQVVPADARVPAGSRINYSMTWTVPPSEVWRDLNTIDLRFRKGNQIPLWLRWDETANTFSVCEESNSAIVCSAAAMPGTSTILQTPLADVYLADTSVVGTGPTGPSVALNLSIAFREKAAGHLYDLEVAATDDFGRQDDFVQATTVHVQQPLDR